MSLTQVLVALGAIVFLGVGGYFLMRRREPKEEPYIHFLCPGCKHRLRYQARQVGHKGKCSHCGHLLSFPPVSQSIA